MAWSIFSPGDTISSSLHNANWSNSKNELGEVRQFALSITGAETKANLQANGWAICDGTTPAAQGISDATITTTPDLREKFLRHSTNETTGGTGGSATHNHTGLTGVPNMSKLSVTGTSYEGGDGHKHTISNDNNLPPYYDICYFMKVKLV